MSGYTDAMVSLVFWAFYGPLSLVALYETGRQDHVLTTLLAGTIVILMYLFGRLVIAYSTSRKKKKIKKRHLGEGASREILPPPKACDRQFPLPSVHMMNVFRSEFACQDELKQSGGLEQ